MPDELTPHDFESSGRLWLLVGVAVLGLVYVALQQRRKQYAVRFTNVGLLDTVAPKRPGWRRHLPAVAYLAALTGLVVAWAKPVDEIQVPREQATVIMAIDTSLSMEATDVEPNRLEAAQAAAKQFLESVPETINIGLVSFDGAARLQVPPTVDRVRVERAIDRLELHEYTAIGEAIFASIEAIEDLRESTRPPDGNGDGDSDSDSEQEELQIPARIVLMSDGETTIGRPDGVAAEAAREANIPVSTIAFGTDDGVIEQQGEIIPVPVNRDALEAIAEDTGGSFFTATSEEQLAQVYADIGSSIGFDTEEREITAWFVGAALIALLAGGAMSLIWFSRLP